MWVPPALQELYVDLKWWQEQTVKQVRYIVCQMMISAAKNKAGWAGVGVQIGCGVGGLLF